MALQLILKDTLKKITKKKISEMFQDHELTQLACKKKFIQRTTSILQGPDFIKLSITD